MRLVNPTIQSFETSSGIAIYQLPLEAFPGLWAYAYLVLIDGYKVLIDTGSGFGDCNDHLEAGIQAVNEKNRYSLGLSDLTHVLITHGHIDHFGGLSFVKENSSAKIGVHELDKRNLTNYEERLIIVANRLEHFLIEAGISPQRRSELVQMYRMMKLSYHSVPVDFTYEESEMCLEPFEMMHVPGHCAGHVVIRLDDVLFSGDHILAEISPHQVPERLTLNTGLGTYLDSLDALQPWIEGVRLTLGGHYATITDLKTRLEEIKHIHIDRLGKVLDYMNEPHTVADVSKILFGEVHGYNVLLALEEAGAHIEYLYQRGLLGIENLDEYEKNNGLVPLYYYRLS